VIHALFQNVQRVLCLGAHADDIEIGCGGTMLRLLQGNRQLDVRWVVLSAAGQRKAEAEDTAREFLADAASRTIVVERFRDSYFPYDGGRLKDFFQRLAQQYSPDLIFTHRREDMHQDHRLVAELTWNAFRDHVILEYEIPKYEGDLGQPNLFFALEEAVCRRKIDGLMRAYPSQRTKAWFSEDLFWSLLRIRGVESNSPTRFAEAFDCRKIVM